MTKGIEFIIALFVVLYPRHVVMVYRYSCKTNVQTYLGNNDYCASYLMVILDYTFLHLDKLNLNHTR